MMDRRWKRWTESMLIVLAISGLFGCGVAPIEQSSGAGEQPVAQQISGSQTTPTSATIMPTSSAAPTLTATLIPPTATAIPPTATAIPPTATAIPPTATAIPPTATAIPPTATAEPIVRRGQTYTAYIEAASKESQAYQYSCEFDAAWVVLATYGIQTSVDQIIAQMPLDQQIEPWYEEKDGVWLIHGGDIEQAYSGDYKKNFLARSTGAAMIPVFARYGVEARPARSREDVEAALDRGELVWIKTTVDFKKWRPALWVMPDGRTQTVLGNDHAVVVMGYNEHGVVIRDVLGPTSSNRQRPLEYDVPWATFLAAWGAQSYDGLSLARPR
jgi:hypothetical protein